MRMFQPTSSRSALLAALATLMAGPAAVATAVQGVAVPAQVVDITRETGAMEHTTTDYGPSDAAWDDREGTTRWRVVKDTGNCCENHFAVTPEGRLFDIGGSFINYTDDQGLTWKSVRPIEPLINGEGSMAVAPNGDVVAIQWDAYTGDHLLAFKWNAVSRQWFYMENVLHHPVYDRPWVTVVPGPFAIGLGADTVPYVTFVQGGTGVKDPMFMSTDGLTYAEASSLTVDGATDTQVTGWFPIKADPSFDWIQPIRSSPVTGLGNGRAMHGSGWLLDPQDRKWDAWRLPGGAVPPSFIQIDSAGRIHNVRSVPNGFEYRVSADGGQSWEVTHVPFGFGFADFHVNRALGVSALAVRVGSQDWVYKFDITGSRARLMRRYRVGKGDVSSGSGVGVGTLTAPRYDFKSVAILPDGRVAVSFLDSTTLSHPPGTGTLGRITPAVAIELDTALPPHLPDLAAGALSLAVTRSTGADDVTFSTTITNGGLGAASGAVVRFIVDGAPLDGDEVIDLEPGASVTVSSAAWSARHQLAGNHTVEVVVDPDNGLAELDETNNAASHTFFVEGNKIRPM